MRAIQENQIGAMNMIYAHHSLGYMLDSFDRIGVKRFELYAPTPHFDAFMPSLSDTERFGKILRQRGFTLTCVTPDQCSYPHNIAISDRDAREHALTHFMRYLDVTAELGVGKMLCGAGWGDVDGDIEEAWKWSLDSLNRMADYAEKKGVLLVFEILNEYESDLVHHMEGMKRIRDSITSPALKFCIDTVPVELEHRTLEEYFSVFGKQIVHIHMTDGSPLGHVPPGLGDYDMEKYFQTLSKYDYDGFVTIEICDTTWSNEPEKATRLGYQCLQKALSDSNKLLTEA